MDFFKDPKYKVVRIFLILVVVVGAGWFTMSNMNQSNSNQGMVINPAKAPASATASKIKTTTSYDAKLNKNIKVSTVAIPAGVSPDLPDGGTLSCTGGCTGDNCLLTGCVPHETTISCTSCTCRGGGEGCSGCSCSRSITKPVILPN
jgi:hypothetical protein